MRWWCWWWCYSTESSCCPSRRQDDNHQQQQQRQRPNTIRWYSRRRVGFSPPLSSPPQSLRIAFRKNNNVNSSYQNCFNYNGNHSDTNVAAAGGKRLWSRILLFQLLLQALLLIPPRSMAFYIPLPPPSRTTTTTTLWIPKPLHVTLAISTCWIRPRVYPMTLATGTRPHPAVRVRVRGLLLVQAQSEHHVEAVTTTITSSSSNTSVVWNHSTDESIKTQPSLPQPTRLVATTDFSPKSEYELRFGGVGRLYANNNHTVTTGSTAAAAEVVLHRLRDAVVVVIGLGGVGSWAAEALGRSGVGTLILIDLDDVCISNTNRQVHAVTTTVAQLKIQAVHDRLTLINPDCRVYLIPDFVSVDNVLDLLQQAASAAASGRDTTTTTTTPTATTTTPLAPLSTITAVLDAMDGARTKAAVLAMCAQEGIPIVTCGGAAGRTNPCRVACHDLTLVTDDRLMAAVKHTLRQPKATTTLTSLSSSPRGNQTGYGFPPGRPFHRKVRRWNIPCVYSDEVLGPAASGGAADASDGTDSTTTTSSFRQCDGALGTACFVTGTFGFVAAATIVEAIARDELRKPIVPQRTYNDHVNH